MSATPNLKINLVSPDEDMTTIDWIMGINGDNDSSMAIKVDRAIEKLRTKELYSEAQPDSQVAGDIWHEIISVTDGGN